MYTPKELLEQLSRLGVAKVVFDSQEELEEFLTQNGGIPSEIEVSFYGEETEDEGDMIEVDSNEEAEYIQTYLLNNNIGFIKQEDIKAVLEAQDAYYKEKGIIYDE